MPIRFDDSGTDIADALDKASAGTGVTGPDADNGAKALDLLTAVEQALGLAGTAVPGKFEANGTDVQDRENSWVTVATAPDSARAVRLARAMDLRYAIRRALNLE